MTLVVDASVTAALLLPDEFEAAERYGAALQSTPIVVPWIWWFEVRNVLLLSERRGRLEPNETIEALRTLAAFDIDIDRAPDEAAILDIARSRRLTVYDASYLELARRREATLATLDAAMIRAAKAEAIPLLS